MQLTQINARFFVLLDIAKTDDDLMAVRMKLNDTNIGGLAPQFRSILAYVDGGPGTEEVIKKAAQIGGAYSAHVEVLHIKKSIDTNLPAMDVGGSLVAVAEIFEIMNQEIEKNADSAKAAFDTYCKASHIEPLAPDSPETVSSHGLSLSWNLMAGNDNRDLATRGRLFDLIVIAKAGDQVGGVDSVQLEAALFDTGRPVFVTSDNNGGMDPRTIAIAWDGSREASHSIALALPLLCSANKVCIMSVGLCEPGLGVEDLGRYLARHEIQSEQYVLAISDKSVADALADASLDNHACLLVMGAYGHSAIGESLFGGVTRDLLEGGKIPLLLAH